MKQARPQFYFIAQVSINSILLPMGPVTYALEISIASRGKKMATGCIAKYKEGLRTQTSIDGAIGVQRGAEAPVIPHTSHRLLYGSAFVLRLSSGRTLVEAGELESANQRRF